MIPAEKRKLGYDDLAGFPDDGLIREILDGELVVSPSPSPIHQRVSKRLQRQLEAYFEERGIGEVFNAPLDTILGPHDIVQPDLLVVTDPATISGRAIERPPPLVIEVLSPSSLRTDRIRKRARYAATGIRHSWLVTIEERHILCLRLRGAEYETVAQSRDGVPLAHSDWPGLTIDAAALWR